MRLGTSNEALLKQLKLREQRILEKMKPLEELLEETRSVIEILEPKKQAEEGGAA